MCSTWSVSGLPPAADVDEGVLAWASGAEEVGVYAVVVNVTDGQEEVTAPFALYLSDPALTAGWTPPTTGDPILPDSRPPTRPALRLVVCAGEIEPASLVVRSAAALGGVTAALGPLVQGGQVLEPDVDWRIVKPWMQAGHDVKPGVPRLVPELLLHDDALVEVEDGENFVRLADGERVWVSEPGDLAGRVVVPVAEFDVRDAPALLPFDLPADTTRQLWLTLDVPADAQPGDWVGVATLAVGGVSRVWVPITVEVLPVQLVTSPLIYSVYYRATLDDAWPDGSISSEFRSSAQMAAELAHLARMGITNPTVYQAYDSPRLTDVLDLRAAAGMTGPLFHVGLYSGGGDLDAVRARVTGVRELAADYGIDEVYAYGRDEARGDDLVAQRPNWEAVHDVGGKNFVAGYRTTAWLGEGNFDLMGDLQDLLVCAYRPSRYEAARWHAIGSRILTYESPQAGHEDPEIYRRNFGLQLWQADYDGVMTYAYMDSFGTAWNDFDSSQHRDLNFAYPTSDGIIPTLQAAGVREAVDDVRYVATLAEWVETAAATGADVSAARAWLDGLRELPLGRADLDALRARTVGHILDLADAAASPGELRLSSAAAGTRNAEGALTVSWSTSGRASGWVEYGPNEALGEETPRDPARVYEHTATIPLGTAGYWRAHAVDASGREVRTEVQVMPGSVAPSLEILAPSEGETVDGGEVLVRLEAVAAHEHALIVSLDDDLLGWWRFDASDLGLDSSTQGHHGTVHGGTQTPGRHGMGLALDGVDDYVDIGNLGIVDGPATVEGWFRFGRFPTERLAASGLHSVLYHHPVNEQLYFTSTNDWFRAASLLTPGSWHHIAVTWSGDVSSGRLFVDGRPLEVNVQGEAEEVPTLADFEIGRSFGYFEGAVDEVRVWRRVLEPDEIQASYDGSSEVRILRGLVPGEHTLRAWVSTAAGDVRSTETRFDAR